MYVGSVLPGTHGRSRKPRGARRLDFLACGGLLDFSAPSSGRPFEGLIPKTVGEWPGTRDGLVVCCRACVEVLGTWNVRYVIDVLY